MKPDQTTPCPGDPSIEIDARNVAVGRGLPMIAYLAEANEANGDWECWDEDEPCDSGGSCGKCLVKVLSGADNLSPQATRERNTIAKLNQVRFGGQLEETRHRLCCQASCRGPVEIQRVEVPVSPRPKAKMDERTLVHGLIVMFQRALSASIKRELYGCAQRVADELGLEPSRSRSGIPDFCKGDAILSHYFQIVEELRHACWQQRVDAMPEFQRIASVMTSPLFGLATSRSSAVTMGSFGCGFVSGCGGSSSANDHKVQMSTPKDAFARAVCTIEQDLILGRVATWSIDELTTMAQSIAAEADDVSLVGLAARVGDPMLMILARLQPKAGRTLDDDPEDEFDWQVGPAFAASVGAFVDVANKLLDAELPAPTADNASAYFWASTGISLGGQCVPLGMLRLGYRNKHGTYHWAIREPHMVSRLSGPEAEQFVDTKLWDSERYTRELYPRGWLDDASPYHRQRAKCACGSGRRHENCHGLEEEA